MTGAETASWINRILKKTADASVAAQAIKSHSKEIKTEAGLYVDQAMLGQLKKLIFCSGGEGGLPQTPPSKSA